MAIGEKIRLARESFMPKISQRRLADIAGIKRSRIAQYETGRAMPPIKIVELLASTMQLTVEELINFTPSLERRRHVDLGMVALYDNGGRTMYAVEQPVTELAIQVAGAPKIKLYGGAGTPLMMIDAEDMDIPIAFASKDFGCVIIQDDSMLPEIRPGDIALFRDWKYAKELTVMAVEIPGGEIVCRLIVYEHCQFVLRSFDERFADIAPPFKVLGFLAGLIRDTGAERVMRMNRYGISVAPPKEAAGRSADILSLA